MAYVKTTWSDGQAPALSAANLNKIEQGIYDASATADTAKSATDSLQLLATAPLVYEEITGGSITLAAHAAGSVTFNVPEKSGYKVLCPVNPRTNGAVMPSYIGNVITDTPSGTVTVWFRNASTGSQTATSTTLGVIYMKADLF